jgi:uncharacterized protein (TIGR00255 family)
MELQGVNRKGLDLALHLPKGYSCCEMALRKQLSAALERGQVTLRLTREEGSVEKTTQALLALKTHWEGVARSLGYDEGQVTFPLLLSLSEESLPAVDEGLQGVLAQLLQEALDQFVGMQEQEGCALADDIRGRLATLGTLRSQVEARRALVEARCRQKVESRLAEWLHTADEGLKQRMMQELALLIERGDIAEEVSRLKIHCETMRGKLAARAVGKTLDFLAQEMHREIGTLGAKASDSEIATLVVEMKGVLEKIREQVQNIE